jgi:hypothetical protein
MRALVALIARTATVAAGLFLLTGCDGLVTGERVSQHPLEQRDDGSFAPVVLTLSPDMNPVAVNFKGETAPLRHEAGRWNTYVANLRHNGVAIAGTTFHVNNTGTSDIPNGGPFARTLFFVTVPEAGDYALSIAVTPPKAITIQAPGVEVRRNTQPVVSR